MHTRTLNRVRSALRAAMSIRIGLIASALLASVLSTSLLVSYTGATTDSPSHAIRWLAAGDSYASGAGLPNTVSPCAQGTGANGESSTWAVVAANELRTSGFSFETGSPDLVACTGAISDEFFHSHTGLLDEIPVVSDTPHGPQWKPQMGRFDLVTFSFGGDDIGFPSIIQHCVDGQGCPSDQAVREKIKLLGSTGVYDGSLHIPPYPTFLRHVAENAVVRGGNVVVMGYPELVEDPTLWASGRTSCAGLSPSVVDTLRGWAGDLNATIGYAVAQANKAAPNGVHFTFIDVVTGQPQSTSAIDLSDPNLFEPANGPRHELCSTGQPWLNGLQVAHLFSRSFHPNQDGENAMGNLAKEVVSHLTWPWSATNPGSNSGASNQGSSATTAGGSRGSASRPDASTLGATVGGVGPDFTGIRSQYFFGPATRGSASDVDQSVLSGCGLDPSTVTVIKTTIETQNASGDTATAPIQFSNELIGSGNNPGQMDFVLQVSSGEKCYTPADGLVGFKFTLAPNAEVKSTMWIVISSDGMSESSSSLGNWLVQSPNNFIDGQAAPGEMSGSRVVVCGDGLPTENTTYMVPAGQLPSSSGGSSCQPYPVPT